MKKHLIFIILSVLFLISCQKENFSTDFNIGQEEEFTYGNQYYSNDRNLKLTILEINDSRCPGDVVCIWQGEAVIKILVETSVSQNIELSTFDNLTDTVGNYSIKLTDVSPYPISTESIELNDYVVSLKIEELTN